MMRTIFFYGLFMDVNLLEDMGFNPEVVGPAELHDYRIRIGNKATLIHHVGSCSYGVVMRLSEDQASALYAAPGVVDYVPEEVEVKLLGDGSVLKALCYNLPLDKVDSGVNTEYAEKLSRLLLDLGFPSAYAHEILSD
jgi:hypothetical protein